MALVHCVYIGHFIPDQGYVRFQGHKPETTRPISFPAVSKLLQSYLGATVAPDKLPDSWGTSVQPDYIACDLLGSPPAALRFAADYAQQEQATILDIGSFMLLTPEQLRNSAATTRHSLRS